MNYIIIDQGISSTKAFLFNSNGEIIHNNTIKHEIFNPKKLTVSGGGARSFLLQFSANITGFEI